MPLLETFGNATVRGFRAVAGGPSDYQLISTQIVSGSVSAVTFTSIPQTFRHLQLRISAKSTTSGSREDLGVRANNDSTASHYYDHYLRANFTSAQAGFAQSSTHMKLGLMTTTNSVSNNYAATVIDLYDYTQTTKNKTFRGFAGIQDPNGPTYQTYFTSGYWVSTAAINRLDFFSPNGGSIADSSRFSLYGWN